MKKVIPFDTRSETPGTPPARLTEHRTTGSTNTPTAAPGVAAEPLFNPSGSEQQLLLLQRLLGCTSIPELLNRYFRWLSDLNLADGVTYHAPRQSEHLVLGNKRHHSAQYELTLDEEALGEMNFCRRERFSEDELLAIEQSLAFFARCLKTAFEMTQLRALATHDPLTGLLNRNALTEWV